MRWRSLRRLLLFGTTVFAIASGGVIVGIVLMFGSLRKELERQANTRVVEQHAADEIVTAVFGQILAAYQQLQEPSERNMERFDSLGRTAYQGLRQYLFQQMPLEARLQVETIKELHQSLEVDAHAAFDLSNRGESNAARVRVTEMRRRTELLQAEMGRFVVLREQEREQLRQRQVTYFQRLLIGITSVGVLLIVFAALFVRLVQRRVVAPLFQLSDAAVRLGGGDLAARIPAQRHDELDTVARRFNEMADSIQEARAEIENRNAELSTTIRNLKQTQQELVQQEKMGAVGFMLAGLAHELNNPLAGVLGTAECIQDELESHSDPEIRRIIRELVIPLIREAERAGTLVRNLLQFSRQSNAQLDAVNVKAVVDISAGLRAFAFAQAGKELRMNVPATLFVRVEPQRMEHVILNIMSNALDAMATGTGTRLVVQAEAVGPDWISLSFEDDGPGFVEPDRIFDAFYTTKAVGTGTGLGLSLVQRFIAEAGGTIAAANVPTGGARLTIRLPAAPVPEEVARVGVRGVLVAERPRLLKATASPVERVEAAEPVGQHASGDRTVLIVDDEPAIRDIQCRFLAKIGIRTVVAANGTEAIAILKRERCDAVVTDIRMPGEIDGIALYRWIELTQPDLAPQCLFVTGEIEAGSQDPIVRAHPQRVISKPFRRDDYLARVLAVLNDASIGV